MEYKYDKEFKGIVATPDCTQEWLELICDIAVDYDGYREAKDLMMLIDELKNCAIKAQVCLANNKIFEDKIKSQESTLNARKERDKDRKTDK